VAAAGRSVAAAGAFAGALTRFLDRLYSGACFIGTVSSQRPSAQGADAGMLTTVDATTGAPGLSGRRGHSALRGACIMQAVWIDTHCHLDAPEFDADRPAVLARARSAGVSTMVLPAVDRAGWEALATLAAREGQPYALGIHPLYVEHAGPDDLKALARELAARRDDPRLVAVGEIGLDHFVPGLDRERQWAFYEHQLRLAADFDLPVILHVRRSADHLLKGLRRVPLRGGIAHAFNGSRQQADHFVALGLRLGFGGAMTFERARQIRELASGLPLEALVLETDAPDIPPQWIYRPVSDRGDGPQRRNEPAELPRIAAVLADLRGLGLEAVRQASVANARAALPRLGAVAASTS
jgi:TatD DNase family protein